jgi:hypothetical protein
MDKVTAIAQVTIALGIEPARTGGPLAAIRARPALSVLVPCVFVALME